MSREEIIRLAEAAGITVIGEAVWRLCEVVAAAEREAMRRDGWRRCAVGQTTTQFCGLLEAAVLAEREACAAICDAVALRYGEGPELEHFQQGFGDGATICRNRIRARRKK